MPWREASLEPHLAAAVVDVFVYAVVLNLFVEYLPQVLSETFTLSLLTAVLLKGVLEVVIAAKNRVKARFRQPSPSERRTLRGLVRAAIQRVDLQGCVVGVTGLEPVTSSL
jgi:hypothetical protein